MRINKRILVISNYPIKEPLHGGQKRVAAIVEEYKKVFSSVKFVAVFVREHYPVYSKDDLYLTGYWAEKARQDHLTSDIQIGHAMSQSPVLKQKIKRLLLSYKPDIIEIEQVFPFIGLQPILEDLNMHPKIVYNSQNIETPMKREIMVIGKAVEKDIEKATTLIDKAETYLARHADLLTAVSTEDGQYYLSRGATRYVLAPNGISKTTASKKSTQYWSKFFKKKGIRRTIIFIGSAHLPNTQGIKKMIGLRLGFLAPDTRLILAGSVGQYLEDHFDHSSLLDSTFWKRTINVGILSEDMLAGLIQAADLLLLPIVDGGGSNLKTAEAILSGKKVVGTEFAFRGYQQYSSLPNIWVTKNNTKDFRRTIIKALEAPLKERSAEHKQLAEHVQWRFCLKKMVEEVVKL